MIEIDYNYLFIYNNSHHSILQKIASIKQWKKTFTSVLEWKTKRLRIILQQCYLLPLLFLSVKFNTGIGSRKQLYTKFTIDDKSLVGIIIIFQFSYIFYLGLALYVTLQKVSTGFPFIAERLTDHIFECNKFETRAKLILPVADG